MNEFGWNKKFKTIARHTYTGVFEQAETTIKDIVSGKAPVRDREKLNALCMAMSEAMEYIEVFVGRPNDPEEGEEYVSSNTDEDPLES